MSLTRGDSSLLDPDDAPPERTRYRLRTTREQRVAIRVIAACSAVGAALSGSEPAGVRIPDLLLLFGLGALVPLAASRARRWTLIVLAGLVAAFARGWLLLLAGSAIAAVAALVLTDRRHRVISALAGALGVQTLLRLPDPGPDWLIPALGTIVVGLVLFSGYRHTHRRQRQVIRVGIYAVTGFVVIASVLFLVALLTARHDIDKGVTTARTGLAALKQGDTEAAADRLTASNAAFASAERVLDAPYALPARAIPIVSDYALTASEVASAGADITGAGAELSSVASYDQLAPRAGQVDLELVESLSGPARRSELALSDAEESLDGLRRTWMVEPVAEPLDDLLTEIDETLPSARLAADGLEVAPALLGADGDRTYLVVMGQPAESRFLGGFAGSYAELSAVDGKVELVRDGPMSDLITAPGAEERTLSGPEEYLARYGRFQPEQSMQNATASPDFPTVAGVLGELYPQAGGKPVDGVIYVDPQGLAALLRLTGPVDLPEYDVQLTSDNAADLLLRDQYELFPGDRSREDFLSAALGATFDALTNRDLPSPRRVGEALGPAASEGHLLFEAFDDDESAFLDLAGSRGEFPLPDGNDLLSVRSSNAGPNKLDVYLRRDILYQARLDPDSGVVESRAVITLENRVPQYPLPDAVAGNQAQREGLPDAAPPGTNFQYLSVYSPLGLGQARIGDAEAPTEIQSEFGYNVYSFLVEIPPGATITLELDLVGVFEDLETYEVTIVPQPLVRPDRVTVEILAGNEAWGVRGPDSSEAEPQVTWTVDELREPEEFEVETVALP